MQVAVAATILNLQGLMLIILLLCSAVLLLHHSITQRFPAIPPATDAAIPPAADAGAVSGQRQQDEKSLQSRHTVIPAASSPAISSTDSQAARSNSSTTGSSKQPGTGQRSTENKPSLGESLRFLARSEQIQCLGIMAMSQGLTTNLLDLAWKTHLHMLHPSPSAYAVRAMLLYFQL